MFKNTLILELSPLERLDEGAKRRAGYQITTILYMYIADI